MATLKFAGLCLGSRETKGSVKGFRLEFQDIGTETRLVFNSPDDVQNEHKFIPVEWEVAGFRNIAGVKGERAYSFFTCDKVTGKVIKPS